MRRSPTLVHYVKHLRGAEPIGIFPLLPDGTCWFAAIDLDAPDFEGARLLQELLPGDTWLERSRSGNVHLLAFFEEPIEAWVPRALMRHALTALGPQYERVETFPKQNSLPHGMLGNYLNLAYFGDERPVLWPGTDAPMYVDEFCEMAYYSRNLRDEWEKRARRLELSKPDQSKRERGERSEPHGCAAFVLANCEDNPLQPGARNVVLFNLSKMLFDSGGMFDAAEVYDLVQHVNQNGVEPLVNGEVHRIVNSAERGGYTSTGCDAPEMSPYVSPDCRIAHG